MRWAFALLFFVCVGIAALGFLHAEDVKAPGAPAPAGAEPLPPGGVVHGLLYEKHLNAGVPCSGCHKQQPPTSAVDDAVCLSCHGPRSALIAKTAGDTPNPHAKAHVGTVPCTSCHHIHVASESYCNKCHTFDMTVP